MSTLREWLRRLQGTLTGKRRDHDMEAELASHLELAAEDLERNGRSREDARRAARLQFGAADQAIEAMRDQPGLRWLDDLALDLRLPCVRSGAVRCLRL